MPCTRLLSTIFWSKNGLRAVCETGFTQNQHWLEWLRAGISLSTQVLIGAIQASLVQRSFRIWDVILENSVRNCVGSVQLSGGEVSLKIELGAGCSKFESSFTLNDLPDFLRCIEGLDETTEVNLLSNSFDECIVGFLSHLLNLHELRCKEEIYFDEFSSYWLSQRSGTDKQAAPESKTKGAEHDQQGTNKT